MSCIGAWVLLQVQVPGRLTGAWSEEASISRFKKLVVRSGVTVRRSGDAVRSSARTARLGDGIDRQEAAIQVARDKVAGM